MAVYLAIFSNLFNNIILATYVASVVLVEMIKAIKNKVKLKEFIKKNLGYFIILIMWAISQAFEASGSRASSFNSTFKDGLVKAITNLKNTLSLLNKHFIIFAGITVVLSIILLIKDKKIKSLIHTYYNIIFSGFFTIIYTILLSAKLGGGYITRTEVLFGFVFYGFLILFIGLGYILKNYEKLVGLTPLLILILYARTNVYGKTFKDPMIGTSSSSCADVDNYIIEQMIEADENGLEEVDIHIPKFSSSDNWPIATYGVGYSRTLYEYGITKNYITVNYVLDESVNELLK